FFLFFLFFFPIRRSSDLLYVCTLCLYVMFVLYVCTLCLYFMFVRYVCTQILQGILVHCSYKIVETFVLYFIRLQILLEHFLQIKDRKSTRLNSSHGSISY